MEVAFSDAAYFSLLLIVITLSIAVACRVFDRRAFASLGVRGGPGWAADFAFGTLWGTERDADGAFVTHPLGRTDKTIASFGEDEAGELYVLSFDEGIDRLVLDG